MGLGTASDSELPAREMEGDGFRVGPAEVGSPVDRRLEDVEDDDAAALSGNNDGPSAGGVNPADGDGLLTTRCVPRDPSGIVTGEDDLLRSAPSSVLEFEFECLSLPFLSATAARTSA